jgi:hypothetical protein
MTEHHRLNLPQTFSNYSLVSVLYDGPVLADSCCIQFYLVNTNFILIVSEINAKGCDLVDLMTYELM